MMKINNYNLAARNINTRFLRQNLENKGKKWIAVCGVAVFMLLLLLLLLLLCSAFKRPHVYPIQWLTDLQATSTTPL